MKDYNNTLRDADTNYEADWNQMNSLVIHNIGKYYWLASRNVYANGSSSGFVVRRVLTNMLHYSNLYSVYSNGQTFPYDQNNGLRPVFRLKSGIKVTSGDGTPENPYTLAP